MDIPNDIPNLIFRTQEQIDVATSEEEKFGMEIIFPNGNHIRIRKPLKPSRSILDFLTPVQPLDEKDAIRPMNVIYGDDKDDE